MVVLGFALGVAGILVAVAIQLVRHPSDAFRYYRSKRSLVEIPLSLVLYISVLLVGGWMTQVLHLGLWAVLLLGVPLGAVGLLADRSFREWIGRHVPRRERS